MNILKQKYIVSFSWRVMSDLHRAEFSSYELAKQFLNKCLVSPQIESCELRKGV